MCVYVAGMMTYIQSIGLNITRSNFIPGLSLDLHWKSFWTIPTSTIKLMSQQPDLLLQNNTTAPRQQLLKKTYKANERIVTIPGLHD